MTVYVIEPYEDDAPISMFWQDDQDEPLDPETQAAFDAFDVALATLLATRGAK